MTPFPRPLVLGHRGARREATENTLRSLARAVELGADGVELDVQRSADGVPVVIHDDTLARTTSATGRVSGLPWATIERSTNATVPSLEQALAWAAAAGAWVNIELKAAGVEEEAARIIRSFQLEGRIVVSSFEPTIICRIAEVAPELHRYLLANRWGPRTIREFVNCDAQGLCLRDDGGLDVILSELDREEIPVVVWTVNSPERIRHLLCRGVAGLISDDPGVAAAIRADLDRC
ncbi:MAG: hypothetical protein GEU90_02075 [Gemmatimonas sp.]|nr:hypothetical protein [Gemmatimonas sp.]